MLLSLGAPGANATVIYYACVTNSNGDIVIVSQNTSLSVGTNQDSLEPDRPEGTARSTRRSKSTGSARTSGNSVSSETSFFVVSL
jgi:hypothetical protein